MIFLDANLLIYAVNADAPLHLQARTWVHETLNGQRGSVALSWFSLVAFVRIITNPKIVTSPRSLDDALQQVNQWIALPDVRLIEPGTRHSHHFEKACRATNAKGNLITDAHLAALAIEHGCELASCDTDFAKFPGLQWINPLQP
ncbi:type II toxin-antitoxin system VapC family toxin [Prosthecobacter sp.]|uniref:type II toxin-antitoxin system VapC family toxin n=1 Tax=Prosthecobacter sp. TaxID=1965333 RepID=UPI003784591B